MVGSKTMKRALVNWGGWDGHEPEACSSLFAGILEDEGFSVDLVNDLDVFLDSSYIAGLDLIVPVWTMSKITPEQEQGLLNGVRSGVGLGGWHGGMADSFRENTEYQWMVGGQFICIPEISLTIESTSQYLKILWSKGCRTSKWNRNSTICM